MDWLGSAELQFAAVVFAVVVAGLGGYEYYRGRFSWPELTFVLMAAAALVASAIEGAAAFLSLPGFVSSLLAGIAGFAFVGLFLYWATERASEAGD